MPDTTQTTTAATDLTPQEKVIALFQFIRELNKLKQKTILNVKDYPWSLSLRAIPDDPENITIAYRDRIEDEEAEPDSLLLSVRKPEFDPCPDPDDCFSVWLEPGWQDFHNYVNIKDALVTLKDVVTDGIHKLTSNLAPQSENAAQPQSAAQTGSTPTAISTGDTLDTREHFSDDPRRVESFNRWNALRESWAEKQKIKEQTRNLFTDLYRLCFELQRDSETMEIIAAAGMLYDKETPELRHPVLTHRVKLTFDADQNIVSIEDTSAPSELYSIALQMLEDINLTALNELRDQLQKNDYHPLDRNDTPAFLKAMVHQLSSDSEFIMTNLPDATTQPGAAPESGKESKTAGAESKTAGAESKTAGAAPKTVGAAQKTAGATLKTAGPGPKSDTPARLRIAFDPCFIVRKRLDGTLKAIEQIIECVDETGEIPDPIRDIVCGGIIELPPETGEETVEEQLAAVGGESIDILLSKEANKEQLEIAKRIENYNAVLVQGPPGTGKTHTIANLMGHFLAQGKSVLVTSYTRKALSVLKEKVAIGLQDLCVSVLDDSNLDMERSVDGITGYMSKTTAHEMKRDMELLAVERREIIEDLADVRRRIFRIIEQECRTLTWNGEDYTPTRMAKFVVEHQDDLNIIPGKVRTHTDLPLTFEQLIALYRSNESLTPEDERELGSDLPFAMEIPAPEEYTRLWDGYSTARTRLSTLENASSWTITPHPDRQQVEFQCPFGTFQIGQPEMQPVQELKEFTEKFENIQSWMKAAAVDGRAGGAYRQRWTTLLEQIRKTGELAEQVLTEQFGKTVEFRGSLSLAGANTASLSPAGANTASLSPAGANTASGSLGRRDTPGDKRNVPIFAALRSIFSEKGHIPKLTLLFHKEYTEALASVTINGQAPASAEDCDLVIHALELDAARSQCAAYWDELLAVHGVAKFFDLDLRDQERTAVRWIPEIQRYLDWYAVSYRPLLDKLQACGFPEEDIFGFTPLDSELTMTDKILSAVDTSIPQLCTACELLDVIANSEKELKNIKNTLTAGKRAGSRICNALSEAASAGNAEKYAESYSELERMVSKYVLQGERLEMLKTLDPIAPVWADAIRNRAGIHGACTVPDNIEDAWKWKQFAGIISEITAQPFRDLQVESSRLSQEYRSITARYAEASAWYHLLRRTEADIDMKQALQGWKQTVKRIGKGTGKNAPAMKAKARELMTRCQRAVPGWIMPINRALENLDPKRNKFDIIIIDEASQADISCLSILYMGSKLIIVGDDRQVSPMAVGVPIDQMNALESMYIRGKIPNSHLYNAKTSVYDIAATTFQPLMLREHFRCVPEIIGFSNMLSYDYKIKPLRDAGSSNLQPAVINYRVEDGKRVEKTNPNEARTIVDLLKDCMERPEYARKTFGIISLLGDDQVKLIQTMIEEEVDPKEVWARSILCGNSAHFQGDERDVIFLSMVDSPREADSPGERGPLHLMGFGSDDATRKRYNVAASRARDQLWIVHSLDPVHDLKPGDIRKTLIEYGDSPHSLTKTGEKCNAEGQSPHVDLGQRDTPGDKRNVPTALRSRGYHIIENRPIGAYCLDMVAVCGNAAVAIEFDGERLHDGEAAIREELEQQTILERLGWHFIRIRGSEYYRAPEETIQRVIDELNSRGIYPEEVKKEK